MTKPFNPRDLFVPKHPEVKKPCASCPFSKDNDAEFGAMVEKLHNIRYGPYPPETPPAVIRGQIRIARKRIEKDVDQSGEFICHCTVYNDDMSMKDPSSWRQCAGATKFYKERGVAKAKAVQPKSGQARKKRSKTKS